MPGGPKVVGSPANKSSPVKDRSPATEGQPDLLRSQAGLQAPHVQVQPQAQQQQQSSGLEKQSMKAKGDQEARQATGPEANDSRLVEWEADRSAGHPLAGSSERRPAEDRHSPLQQPQAGLQAPHMQAQIQAEEKQRNDTSGGVVPCNSHLILALPAFVCADEIQPNLQSLQAGLQAPHVQAQPQAQQQQSSGLEKQSMEAGADQEGRQATGPEVNGSRKFEECTEARWGPATSQPASQNTPTVLAKAEGRQLELSAPQLQAEKKQRSESSGSGSPSTSCLGSAVPPAQPDRSSGPSSHNTPPDTPSDVPARSNVFLRLSRMPAPTCHASTHQAEEHQKNESSGSGFSSTSCPCSAVPPAQSDRSSGPSSPNTPPDTPPDVPARSSVFLRLSRMPAPTCHASTHQVELLLTLEEYCEEERDHTAHGHCFEAVFQQVVKLLYDDDIIEEDAVLVWADEKQMAEEDERKYLKKAAAFIAWLREAESEEETSSVDSD